MCDVATLVGVVIAGAATVQEADQARKNRNREERFRLQRELQEKANALQAQRIEIAEIHEQQIADADAAALDVEANRRQARAAIGTAQTIAGESGSFGLSFEGLVGEFSRQQAEFEQAVDRNLAIRNQFALLNLQSAALGTRARLINAETQSIPQPNYTNFAIRGLGTGFQIGSGVRQGLNSRKKAQAQ